MRVAVLGCGPAGLMAAQAAQYYGAQVDIFSRRVPSQLYGAQYLHGPIMGLPAKVDSFDVDYQLWGTPDLYRMKVYGDKWDGSVSPEDLTVTHRGWNIRQAYDSLWHLWERHIRDITIKTAEGLDRMVNLSKYDLVISSLPRPLWGTEKGHFTFQEIWAKGMPRDEAFFSTIQENTVICNGAETPSWYRASCIGGWVTVEWPKRSKPPIQGVVKVQKPLAFVRNETPAMEDSFLHVGRYGEWKKGILSTDAYNKTLAHLELMTP